MGGDTPLSYGMLRFYGKVLNEAVQAEATKGNRAHMWLTQTEVRQLMDSCDTSTLQGQRDKIVLGLLGGAGLRREELTNLTFDAVLVQRVAGRSGRVLNVTGKRAKDWIVPINDKLATAIDDWASVVNGRH